MKATPGSPEEPILRMFPRNEVHVWHADLLSERHRWLPAAMAVLSDEERVRHSRYVREQDAGMFALARAMLRFVLSQYVEVSPQGLPILSGPFGKPHLDPTRRMPFRFNATHSGGTALVAVTVDREVGIDVEALRQIERMEALVRRTFSAGEQAGILGAPDRRAAFFATWTRKEAVVKALGRGLRFPLDAFDVETRPAAPPALLASRDAGLVASHWTMHSLPEIPGFASALAVETALGSTVVFREWQLTELR